MSPTDDRRVNEPLDTRLRIDPNKVTAARSYLGEIDAAVFAVDGKHRSDAHASVVARAVAALFGRG